MLRCASPMIRRETFTPYPNDSWLQLSWPTCLKKAKTKARSRSRRSILGTESVVLAWCLSANRALVTNKLASLRPNKHPVASHSCLMMCLIRTRAMFSIKAVGSENRNICLSRRSRRVVKFRLPSTWRDWVTKIALMAARPSIIRHQGDTSVVIKWSSSS